MISCFGEFQENRLSRSLGTADSAVGWHVVGRRGGCSEKAGLGWLLEEEGIAVAGQASQLSWKMKVVEYPLLRVLVVAPHRR